MGDVASTWEGRRQHGRGGDSVGEVASSWEGWRQRGRGDNGGMGGVVAVLEGP